MENSEFDNVPEQDKVDFPYLDRDEAMFLLGRIRDSIECSLCPRWVRGCTANHTRAEMMGIPLKQFVERQVSGTEGHMCAKLRNIVNMSDAEISMMNKSFDAKMKTKIGFLDKVDGKTSYVNISADNQIQQLEKNFNEKIAATKDYYEKQVAALRLEANRKIDEALRMQAQYHYLADQASALEEAQRSVEDLRSQMQHLLQENAQLKQSLQPPQ